jgi:hypothetical protein
LRKEGRVIASLVEIKKWLQIGDNKSDHQLVVVGTGISRRMERYCRTAIEKQTITETFDGSRYKSWGYIPLGNSPIVSFTSLSQDGTAIAASEFDVSTPEGLLWFSNGWSPDCGRGNLTATYEAGYEQDKIPSDIVEVFLMEVAADFNRRDKIAMDTMSDGMGGSVRLKPFYLMKGTICALHPYQRQVF